MRSGFLGLAPNLITEVNKVKKSTKIQKIFGLSPMQQGMLFHSLLEENSEAYFEQICFSIVGAFQIDLFEKSINILAERYEVLRTNFVYEKIQQPKQVVLLDTRKIVFYEDLTTLDGVEISVYLEKFKLEDRRKGFNLSGDALMRIQVFKVDSESYRVIWSYHHIIMDAWCLGTLSQELGHIYYSLQNNESFSLTDPTPYSSYINWLMKQDQEEGRGYWKEYLEHYNLHATIPLKSSNENKKYVQREHSFTYDEVLTQKLQAIASTQQVTINTVFQTMWGILLQRYNNVNDVVFGSVVSGRPSELAGVEKMVGLFINTIPVRISTAKGQTFTSLLKQVQNRALDSEKYDYISLAEIQSDSTAKDGLIEHIILFQNFPVETMLTEIFNKERVAFEIKDAQGFEQTNYDFSITVSLGKEINIKFKYNAEVYKGQMVKAIETHLTAIAENISIYQDILIEDIEVVNDEEKQLLLHQYNKIGEKDIENQTIDQLFEQQAEQCKADIALIYDKQSITYRELNERSNQLARLLRSKGVTSGNIVGVMVDRSIEMIVGILGVLKAGGAYLPLDPDYPSNRLQFMLEDSGTKVLLTETALLGRVSFFSGYVLDLKNEEYYIHDGLNLEREHHIHDIAYLIYTSGSTGVPKGVLVEHKALTNFVDGITERIPFKSYKSIAALTTVAFDIFFVETLLPLTQGLQVVIATRNQQTEPGAICELLINNKIDILQITPSRLKLLINQQKQIGLENIKIMMVGGEAFPNNQLAELKKMTNATIYNMYGPTETTIWSSIFNVTNSDEVYLGEPISNTQIHILNEHKKLQPQGAVGEICISGYGVARGYMNRPELSEERFVPDPYVAGQKMYMTGDIGRRYTDGAIEYLGRADDQVKIRGFRIELSEVESRLLQHREIKEAAVVAKPDEDGNHYLVAFIVCSYELMVSEIRAYLSNHLPDYMLPSLFIELDAIPLTLNGKKDRKALSNYSIQTIVKQKYTSPQNELEEKLLHIWTDILKHDRIGIHDNFFELGGHSLKVMMLVSKIEKELNSKVSIKLIFEHPTVAELAEYIQGEDSRCVIPLAPVGKKDYYTLSSAQERLYFLSYLEKNSVNYNIPVVVSIKGNIDKHKIKQAYEKLVSRHEILRTGFELVNKEPLQKIYEQLDCTNAIHYFQCSENLVEDVIKSFIIPHELDKPSLIRVGLISVDHDRHVLMIDVHHIIADGISVEILLDEFVKLYQGEVLPDLTIQYKDYTEWHKVFRSTEQYINQGDYWKKVLSGEIPILNMATDYPRPSIQSTKGATIYTQFDGRLTQEIKELSLKRNVTVYMILLAAYNVLLYKYTGQEDIIVGSSISGRNNAALEQTVGLFINTLAIRNQPVSTERFDVFLEKVKQNCLEAYDNQDYQFKELVDQLSLERDAGRNPLFDTLFDYKSEYVQQKSLIQNDLQISPYPYDSLVSKVDLEFNVFEHVGSIGYSLIYCTDLFHKETVERLNQHFINILKEIVANPEIKISQIAMLSTEEREAILTGFNDTIVDLPMDQTFINIFEAQVRMYPANTALVHDGQKISYAELNDQANRIARFLANHYNVDGSFISVLMNRTPLFAASILAIWKLGKAYIPIDPEYPDQRIMDILNDSGVELLLTTEDCSENIKEQYKGTILHLGIYGDYIRKEDSSNLGLLSNSDDLAYVIYTSGSTGKPKGAMVEHIGMLNHMQAKITDIEINQYSVIAQNASHCFDISIWQMFSAMLVGGTTVIYSNEMNFDPLKLVNQIEQDGITILELVPSILSIMLNYLENHSIPLTHLNYLLVTGEPVKATFIKKWFELYPNIKVVNAYGPTEASDDVTHHIMSQAPDEHGIVPIGKPIQNFRIYIVDQHMNLCPIGVKGEICVSGLGVGKGYLNDPEKTKKVFTTDPFVKGRTERLYRTGDIGAWLPDGSIQFYGRQDFQVKIRGFRVELGEIEQRLVEHENVKDAVVVEYEDAYNNKNLCAYIVLKSSMNMNDLRSFLSRKLPVYMVPGFFVEVEHIPLTLNGKINKKALPSPKEGLLEDHYSAPRNQVEEILVKVWAEVLGANRVGISENFFYLGGDSIKALQVSVNLMTYNLKLDIKDLFLYPTIEELSQYVSFNNRTVNQSIVTGSVELTPIQYWFFEQQFPNMNHWNQSAMLQKNDGEFNESMIRTIFNQIVKHHDLLRVAYTISEEGTTQYIRGIDEGPFFELETFDFSREADCEALIKNKANQIQESIDLQQGPIMRLGLFKTPDSDHLLIVAHHLVMDGLSWRVILEDFSAGYLQSLQQQEIRFQDKTDSYQEWASKLFKYANGEEVQREITYWMNMEQQYVGPLPKDYDATTNSKNTSETAILRFTGEETNTLLKHVNQAYNTMIDDILLTALVLAVKSWKGEAKLLINLEGHGRESILEDINVSRTVGWFTSEYPVLIDIEGVNDLPNQIKAIKEILRKVPNKGIGYNILKYLTDVDKKADLRFNLKPEMSLNYLGQFDREITTDLFRPSPYSTGSNTDLATKRQFNIEINALVTEGELQCNFTFDANEYEKSTIRAVMNHFKSHLLKVIDHCRNITYTELTPSDFMYDRMSLEELDQLKEELESEIAIDID